MIISRKRTLHIWISCALLGCGLFLSLRQWSRSVQHAANAIDLLLPPITPMVVPTNSFQAVAPRTNVSDPAAHGELALEAIKGDYEEWTAQATPQVIATQLPTSYMNGSPVGMSSCKPRTRSVHSVGGGQGFNVSSLVSVTPSVLTGKVIAQATILLPTPKMTAIRAGNTSDILEPFSDELPFADIQRAPPPGSGSGGAVGGVTPIGDCPWVLLPIFFFYIYRRQRTTTA
ncbi:MAG: hypothetical protein J6V13_01610 [Paludibacteraceae bacterium]|nr:hypothetical protein [Paludibacteraceae bacterium]